MKSPGLSLGPLCLALITAGLLSACGGGGGGGDSSSGNPPAASGGDQPANPSQPGLASTLMSCPDGTTYQCSGRSVIERENGITVTDFGVQAYGASTSDLVEPIVDPTGATGFAPASGGLAEARVDKGGGSTITRMALLLSNLGLLWDGVNERPLIIETFNTTAGRSTLNGSGAIVESALPPETDLAFYDYGTRGDDGTQANYANNRYFPRSAPARGCPAGMSAEECRTETAGLRVSPATDSRPQIASATRVHGDGDVHAGNGPNDSSGNPTYITGGTGPGVPFAGSKGYRAMDNWTLQYANLATWVTQDTINIEEWAHLGKEHNKNRRGLLAYGAVTNPALVPTSGSASYSGIAYGWYASNATVEPAPFLGTAVVTVDFATRQASITVSNTNSQDNGSAVPLSFTAAMTARANGSELGNYMTGTATAGSLPGGVSGRYFGPVTGTGSSAGPAETAGAFQFATPGGGALAIGGFLATRQ